MRMRLLLASILIFATVIFFCSALPEGKGKVHSSGLLESANAKGHGNPLQRRKPPVKIPGPKLSADKDNPGHSTSSPEKEQKMKKLSATEKDKDHKRKHAANESKHNGDRREDTQEEKSSLL